MLLMLVKGRWECRQEKPTPCSTESHDQWVCGFGLMQWSIPSPDWLLASWSWALNLRKLIFIASLLPARTKMDVNRILAIKAVTLRVLRWWHYWAGNVAVSDLLIQCFSPLLYLYLLEKKSGCNYSEQNHL